MAGFGSRGFGSGFGGGMTGFGSRTAAPQSPPSFDMSNPFGFLQNSAPQGNFGDIFNPLIYGAGTQGVFDPTGNQAIFGALQQDAQRQSLGRGRSAINFARNNAVDPSAAGYAGLMAMLGSQSDLADALLNARTQSGLQSQNFYQNLLNSGLGNNWGWQSADQAYKINQGLAQAKPKSDIGGFIGQLGGAALGGWLAPGGFWGGAGTKKPAGG